MSDARGVALITGASAGIGATFARVLAAVGLDLVLVARRQDRLEQLAAELRDGCGIGAEPLTADLATEVGISLVAGRIAATDNLAFLINNAGFGTVGKFWKCDLESQEKMHRLHVMATVRLTHAALQGMVPRDSGAVVNVASVAGFAPAPGNASYCSTKAWMIAFTEALWMELKTSRSRVRVQALCPGFTRSEFHEVAGIDPKTIPGPLWMQAEQIVEASMHGIREDRPVVVPGAFYRALATFMRTAPRDLYYRGVTYYARRAGRNR